MDSRKYAYLLLRGLVEGSVSASTRGLMVSLPTDTDNLVTVESEGIYYNGKCVWKIGAGPQLFDKSVDEEIIKLLQPLLVAEQSGMYYECCEDLLNSLVTKIHSAGWSKNIFGDRRDMPCMLIERLTAGKRFLFVGAGIELLQTDRGVFAKVSVGQSSVLFIPHNEHSSLLSERLLTIMESTDTKNLNTASKAIADAIYAIGYGDLVEHCLTDILA